MLRFFCFLVPLVGEILSQNRSIIIKYYDFSINSLFCTKVAFAQKNPQPIEKGKSDIDDQILLENGADTDTAREGESVVESKDAALLAAVQSNSIDADSIRALIEDGADVNAKDEYGNSVLHDAVRYNQNADITQLLIDKGADVNASTNREGESVLHYAAQYNQNADIIPLLIYKGADVNAVCNRDRESVLHYAVRYNQNADITQLLIDKGADVNAVTNRSDESVLQWAQIYGNEAIVQILLDNGAVMSDAYKDDNGVVIPDPAKDAALLAAVQTSSDADSIRSLIAEGADVNAVDSDGASVLHHAARFNKNADITRLLIEKGANVNAVTTGIGFVPFGFDVKRIGTAGAMGTAGASVLHYAAAYNENVYISQLLIEDYGVDASATDSHGVSVLHYAAAFNVNPDIFRLLIEDYGADASATNSHGASVLHYAAAFNANPDIFRLLIGDYGLDVNSKSWNFKSDGDSILHYAVEFNVNPDITRVLIEDCGANVNATNHWGFSVLHHAVEFNVNPDITRLLIDNGANVNAVSDDLVSVLQSAQASAGDAIVQILLENGADISWPKHAALLEAVKTSSNADTIRSLIEDGADVNAVDNEGTSVLHNAARFNINADITWLLIEKGANVNALDSWGRSVLHLAAFNKNLNITRLLIEDYGANVNATTKEGASVLVSALGRGTEVATILIEHGANVNPPGFNILHHVMQHLPANESFATFLIDMGADVDATNAYGDSVLQYVLRCRHQPEFYDEPVMDTFDCLDMARLLIDKGANVNAANFDGDSVLHCAVKYADTDLVQLVIERGANVDAADSYGDSVLHYAMVFRVSIEYVRLLVEHGANAGATNNHGESVLHYSVQYASEDVTRLLIEHGAGINATDSYGNSVLHLAISPAIHRAAGATTNLLINTIFNIRNHGIEFLKWHEQGPIALLIEMGANIDAANSLGESVLHFAARYRSENAAQLLIESGAYVDAKNSDGDSVLHVAVYVDASALSDPPERSPAESDSSGKDSWGNDSTGKDSSGSDSSDKDSSGKDSGGGSSSGKSSTEQESAGKASSGKGSERRLRDAGENIARLLIENQANINATNSDGDSVLHYVMRYTTEDLARVVIEEGADVTATNNKGQSVAHDAVRFADDSVTRLLILKGADVTAVNTDGQSVLYYAVQYGGDNLANVIVQSVADATGDPDVSAAIQKQLDGLQQEKRAAQISKDQYGEFLSNLAHGAALCYIAHFGDPKSIGADCFMSIGLPQELSQVFEAQSSTLTSVLTTCAEDRMQCRTSPYSKECSVTECAVDRLLGDSEFLLWLAANILYEDEQLASAVSKMTAEINIQQETAMDNFWSTYQYFFDPFAELYERCIVDHQKSFDDCLFENGFSQNASLLWKDLTFGFRDGKLLTTSSSILHGIPAGAFSILGCGHLTFTQGMPVAEYVTTCFQEVWARDLRIQFWAISNLPGAVFGIGLRCEVVGEGLRAEYWKEDQKRCTPCPKGHVSVVNSAICEPCEPGRALYTDATQMNESVIVPEVCKACRPGSFAGQNPNTSSFTDVCLACTGSSSVLSSGAEHCQCKQGYFQSPASRIAHPDGSNCTVCPDHMSTEDAGSESLEDCKCLGGSFRPDPGEAVCKECKSFSGGSAFAEDGCCGELLSHSSSKCSCKDPAVCNNTIRLKPGYMVKHILSNDKYSVMPECKGSKLSSCLYRCMDSEAGEQVCPGGFFHPYEQWNPAQFSSTAPEPICSPFRNTTIGTCAKCLPGYIPAGGGASCEECKGSNYGTFAAFALVVVLVFMAQAHLESQGTIVTSSRGELVAHCAISLVISQVQSYRALSFVDTEWPGLVLVFQRVASVFTFDLDIVSFGCVVETNPIASVAMTSVALLAGLIGLLTLQDWLSRRWGKPGAIGSYPNAVGTLFARLYLAIFLSLMVPISQFSHPDPGVPHSLSRYPFIPASWEGQHLSLLLVSLAGFLLWIVPFLSWCAWATFVFRYKVMVRRDLAFVAAHQFLFDNFKPEFYWYGPLQLVRNTLISFIPALLTRHFAYQVASFFIILTTFSFVQVLIQPWRSRVLNAVEAFATMMYIMVLFLGVVLRGNEVDDRFAGILSAFAVPSFIVAATVLAWGVKQLFRPSPVRLFHVSCSRTHHVHLAKFFCRSVNAALGKNGAYFNADPGVPLDRVVDLVKTNCVAVVCFVADDYFSDPCSASEAVAAVQNDKPLFVVQLGAWKFSTPIQDQHKRSTRRRMSELPQFDKVHTKITKKNQILTAKLNNFTQLTTLGIDAQMIEDAIQAMSMSEHIFTLEPRAADVSDIFRKVCSAAVAITTEPSSRLTKCLGGNRKFDYAEKNTKFEHTNSLNDKTSSVFLCSPAGDPNFLAASLFLKQAVQPDSGVYAMTASGHLGLLAAMQALQKFDNITSSNENVLNLFFSIFPGYLLKINLF